MDYYVLYVYFNLRALNLFELCTIFCISKAKTDAWDITFLLINIKLRIENKYDNE